MLKRAFFIGLILFVIYSCRGPIDWMIPSGQDYMIPLTVITFGVIALGYLFLPFKPNSEFLGRSVGLWLFAISSIVLIVVVYTHWQVPNVITLIDWKAGYAQFLQDPKGFWIDMQPVLAVLAVVILSVWIGSRILAYLVYRLLGGF